MYENACIEIQRHLEDARTSKIAHFEMAVWYDYKENIMAFTNGISVALILAWLLSSQFKAIIPQEYQPIFQEIIPMILTMIVASVSAVASIVRFREHASENRLAAQKYQTLWRNCMNWRTDFPDSS